MRYEVMRLLQFVFSMCLVLGAFGGGLLLGWHRWGRGARRSVDISLSSAATPTAAGAESRFVRAEGERDAAPTDEGPSVCVECGATAGGHDLFAPEFADQARVIHVDADPMIRGELPSGAPAAS